MYKEDVALNNLQWLICHKTKPSQQSKILLEFSQTENKLTIIVQQSTEVLRNITKQTTNLMTLN